MQIECSGIINGTLSIIIPSPFYFLTLTFNTETVSQMKKAVMNYSNYDMRVIQKFKVKLVGWTYNKFVSPFEIHTIDDVRTLAEALRCGRCHWVRLTSSEITRHAKDVETRKAAGETVGKARKIRSDVGTKRPRKGIADDSGIEDSDNEPGPSKKRKTAVPEAAAARKINKGKGKESKKRKTAAPKAAAAGKKTNKGKSKARSSKSSKSQLPPAISKEFINDSDDESYDGSA